MPAKKERQLQVSRDEEQQLRILLTRVTDALLKLSNRELRSLGISTPQAGVFVVLSAMTEANVSPTPAEISRWMVRKPNTITGLLDRMERQGLLKLIRDQGGERGIRVEMTEKGSRIYRELDNRQRLCASVLASLSSKQRQQLRTLLSSLERKSREVMGKAPFP